jgi:glycine cleavage system H lipoate-binding protein
METGMLSELQNAKTMEYLIAVAFLMLFVPFWRYIAPRSAVRRPAARVSETDQEWFSVPDGVRVHPGHTWAIPTTGGEVLVGIDDFARAYVGPVHRVEAPPPGSSIRQGEPAWTLHGAGGRLTLTSPVSGIVRARRDGERLEDVSRDPYGQGWLLRVEATELDRDSRHLLSGSAARAWMEDTGRRLRETLAPGLGPALADGGVALHGYAAGLPADLRRSVAREFFFDDGEER